MSRDWQMQALRLFISEGKTFGEVAEAVNRPLQEVHDFVGREVLHMMNKNYDARLRAGGYK